MGDALEANKTWKDDKSFDAIHWHRHTPLSKFILCSLYIFKTLKSSSTWFIPASLYKGPFFYFYVELVFLPLYVSEANTCVKFVCNNFYMLVYCTYYISLCWQYAWDIYVESWKPVLKLKSSYVLIDAFYLESIALWVNSYAKLFDACLQSTIHEKKIAHMIQLFIYYLFVTNYRPLPWITSIITCALQYYLIKIV